MKKVIPVPGVKDPIAHAWSIAKKDRPEVKVGIEFQTKEPVNLQRILDEDFAQHLAHILPKGNTFHMASKEKKELGIYSVDQAHNVMLIVNDRGNLRYFDGFPPRKIDYEALRSLYRDARTIGKKLEWPLGKIMHKSIDYILSGEIPLYFMGGNKKLIQELDTWQDDLKSFGSEIFRKILDTDKFDVTVEKEYVKSRIHYTTRGDYKKGHMKSIIKAVMSI